MIIYYLERVTVKRHKIDRTEHIEKIFSVLRELANDDMRIGQIFEIIRGDEYDDLYNIENDKLLKLLRDI